MEQNPPLSAGAQANKSFVDKMRAQQPELQDQIPVDCKDCSTAWLLASLGRAETRLQLCPGRAETEIGGLALTACHLPSPS